jgi:rubrerythrin
VLAQNVLQDIANEEKVHAGEFLRLLKELDPAEEGFYQQGALEVETEFLGGIGQVPVDSPAAATPPSVIGQGLGIGSLKK